jgi:hypothetical protein
LRSRYVEKFNHDEDEALRAMASRGFETVSRRFSDLTWGILAMKSA